MTTTFAKRIATRIAAELKAAGRTQTQLADHLGIAQPNVSKRFRGLTSFSLDDMPKVAEFLGCSVEDLIGGPAAGNSGQHSVSPAPTHVGPPRASREAESGKDRPAATDEHTKKAS